MSGSWVKLSKILVDGDATTESQFAPTASGIVR